jgi:hypothetical protein
MAGMIVSERFVDGSSTDTVHRHTPPRKAERIARFIGNPEGKSQKIEESVIEGVWDSSDMTTESSQQLSNGIRSLVCIRE